MSEEFFFEEDDIETLLQQTAPAGFTLTLQPAKWAALLSPAPAREKEQPRLNSKSKSAAAGILLAAESQSPKCDDRQRRRRGGRASTQLPSVARAGNSQVTSPTAVEAGQAATSSGWRVRKPNAGSKSQADVRLPVSPQANGGSRSVSKDSAFAWPQKVDSSASPKGKKAEASIMKRSSSETRLPRSVSDAIRSPTEARSVRRITGSKDSPPSGGAVALAQKAPRSPGRGLDSERLPSLLHRHKRASDDVDSNFGDFGEEEEAQGEPRLTDVLRTVQIRENQNSPPHSPPQTPQQGQKDLFAREAEAPEPAPEEVSTEPTVKYAMTLLEALNRYEGEYQTERLRVQIHFERFALHDGEVSRECLHSMLINLGFLTSTPSKAKQLASDMFSFASMDFADFTEFVANFQQHERQTVVENATAWLELEPEERTEATVHEFLRSVGVVLEDGGLARALQMGCRSEELANLDMKGLLRVLAACRVNEGFSAEEIETARGIFMKLQENFGLIRRGWGDDSIKVTSLTSGMMEFFTIYCMRHFQEVLKRLPHEHECTQGVCFYEFLVWLRRLRDQDVKETWHVFHKVDAEKTGRINMDGVTKVIEMLGFTLIGSVVDELMEEIGVQAGDELDFGATARFLVACRQCHGFNVLEREEYTGDFNRFDKESNGELTNSQVLELLRYMGQTLRVDEVYNMIDKVDFNKNGTMDPDEFLTLMRLVREKELALARKAYEQLRGDLPGLPPKSLPKALEAVFETQPPMEMVHEMMKGVIAPLKFDKFWEKAAKIRTRSVVTSRQCAGFAPEVVRQIEAIFQGNPDQPRKFLNIGELIWMLSESKFPVNTSQGRKDLLKRLDVARADAIACGVPESGVGAAGSEEVGYYTCVHLMRSIVREVETKAIEREEEAIAKTHFTSDEVAEFRQVFTQIAMAGKDQRKRRSLGSLLDHLTSLPVIADVDMMKMLKTIGMRVSLNQMHELNNQIKDARKAGGTPDGSVDFVCFLMVVRWMLDTDYAGVNTAAAKQASEAAPTQKKGARFDPAHQLVKGEARALVRGSLVLKLASTAADH